MRFIKLSIVLSLAFFIKLTAFGQASDCATADCLQSSGAFSDVVFGPGGLDQVGGCLLTGENQVHWYCFEAITGGSFEMLIAAQGLAADYDFAIYAGCPNDGGAQIACNYEGPITPPGPFFTTGIATNPMGSFGASANPINPNVGGDEWEPTIILNPGSIYYLIVNNISVNGVGFSIQFGGNASIGSPSPPNMAPGPITGEINVCEGDVEDYSVPALNGVNLIWSGPPDAILVENDNVVTVTWGATSGQICVEAEICGMTSPQGCINVNVAPVPNVSVIPPGPICADQFDLSSLNIIGALPGWNITYYANQTSAQNGFPQLGSPMVMNSGVYWIRVESGPGCFSVIPVSILFEKPDIIVTLQPGLIFCEPDQVDLSQVLDIVEISGLGINGLTITFHDNQQAAMNGNPSLIPPVVTISGTYWIRASTANGCFDIESIMINIDPQPIITVTDPDEICTPPLEYDLMNTMISVLVGNQITTSFVFYDDPNNAAAGISPLGNTVVTMSGVYYVVAVSENGCVSDVMPINVVIGNGIHAELSGSDSLCVGEDAILTITFTGGVTPYTVVLEDAQAMQYNIVTSDNPHVETISISQTTSFSIVSFSDNGNSNCTPTFDGIAAFFVAPPPDGMLEGDTSICCGGTADFLLHLNGIGPFDVEIEHQETGMITMLNNIDSGHIFSVMPCSFATYSLISISDSLGCTSQPTSLGLVDILDAPVISNLVESMCINQSFTVSFDISGGDAGSYTVLGVSGTLIGNSFVSDPLSGSTTYTIEVFDMYGCDTAVISNTVDCNCVSDAGTMDNTLIEVCGTDLAMVNYNNDGTFEPEDILSFVLHTDPGNMLGTVIGWNDQGIFGFDMTQMTYGTMYYISAVVADSTLAGAIDQSDQCLAVSIGSPVIFYELPTANVNGLAVLCQNESFDVTVNVTGEGPFTLNYNLGANPQTAVSSNTAPVIFTINPTVDGQLTLVDISDAHCFNTAMGTLDIQIVPALNIGPVVYNCDNTNTSYVAEFNITGGNGSYDVLGLTGGTLTGASFVSNPIPSGNRDTFYVTDNTMCDTLEVALVFNCSCTTQAGTIVSQTVELCDDELFVLTETVAPILDGDDLVEYGLLDGTNPLTANILFRNGNGTFGFNAGAMQFGVTYYVVQMVGSGLGSQVNMQDPCLSSSSALPVTWFSDPVAAIDVPGSGIFTCTTINIILDGMNSTGMNTLLYSWSTTNGTIDGPMDQSSLTITSGGTYTLEVTDAVAGCTNSTSVVIGVDGNLPVVSIEPPNPLTCMQPQMTLDGSASTSGMGINYTWSTMSGNIVSGQGSNQIVVDMPGTYVLTVINTQNNCENSSSVVVISDQDNPMAAISVMGELDCNTLEVTLDGSASSSGTDIIYQWSTTDGNIVSGQGSNTAGINSGGTYVLHVINQATGCESESQVIVMENQLVPTDLDLTLTALSCEGTNDGSISINNVVGGNPPYMYSLNGGALSANGIYNGLASGDYVVEVTDSRGCTYSTQITLSQPGGISVDLGGDQQISLGDSIRLIADLILSQGAMLDTVMWTGVINQPDENGLEVTAQPAITTVYSITVISQDGCIDQDEVLIGVRRTRPVYTPNIFSPNGDGLNDRFTLFGGQQADRIAELKIYDRWGEELFSAEDIALGDESLGWDGSFKGEPVNNGVYIFYSKVLFKDGVIELVKGDLTLMR